MPTYGNGSVYQRKDGRWVAKITQNGKATTRYAKSEREALTLLTQLWKSQEGQAAPGESPAPTVAAFAEMWLGATRLKPLTYVSYRSVLRSHVLPIIGDMPLDRVTAADVARIVERVLSAGKAAQTARNAHGVTSRLFAVAVDWMPDTVPMNPATRVKPPRREPVERRFWTREETERFIGVCAEGNRHRQLGAATTAAVAGRGTWDDLFLVAVLTGLRLGELLALSWESVDFAAATLTVKHSLADMKGGVQKITPPKSRASLRVVALPAEALAALQRRRDFAAEAPLRDHLEARYVYRQLAPQTYRNGTVDNVIPRQTTLARNLKAACQRANVPPLTVHGLRHQHASLLALAGVPVKAAAQRLGHASASVTLNIYTHVLGDSDRRAVAALETLLGSKERERQDAALREARQRLRRLTAESRRRYRRTSDGSDDA